MRCRAPSKHPDFGRSREHDRYHRAHLSPLGIRRVGAISCHRDAEDDRCLGNHGRRHAERDRCRGRHEHCHADPALREKHLGSLPRTLSTEKTTAEIPRPDKSGLSRNSMHYWCRLSNLHRASLIRPRRATDPSPGPRPDEVHRDRGPPSPQGRGQHPFATYSVSDITDSGFRLYTLRMTGVGSSARHYHAEHILWSLRASPLSC